jgi:hypothetical protein
MVQRTHELSFLDSEGIHYCTNISSVYEYLIQKLHMTIDVHCLIVIATVNGHFMIQLSSTPILTYSMVQSPS